MGGFLQDFLSHAHLCGKYKLTKVSQVNKYQLACL